MPSLSRRLRGVALGCALVGCLAVSAGTASSADPDGHDRRERRAAATRIVIHPIGDSITYGVNRTGVDTPGGYRGALGALLDSAGIEARFVGTSVANPPTRDDPALVGHDGWPGRRIDEMTASLRRPTPLGGGDWLVRTGDRAPLSSDVTVVMAGVNDVYQHYDSTHPEAALTAQTDPAAAEVFVADAAHRLYHLVRSIHRLDPGTSFVLCTNVPLELIMDPDHPADALIGEALNKLIRHRVLQRLEGNGIRVELADVEAGFRASTRARPDVDLIDDGVHPTTAGYAVLAKTVSHAVVALTEKIGPGFRPTPRARD